MQVKVLRHLKSMVVLVSKEEEEILLEGLIELFRIMSGTSRRLGARLLGGEEAEVQKERAASKEYDSEEKEACHYRGTQRDSRGCVSLRLIVAFLDPARPITPSF
ncbi:uncharacterized protein MYCFIDRAFT_179465 [Pseudocercospora fijiensis CIRAD86]|uniref:Uncharacterized protein n=1 Tax=Pseudocercospora fijiensis (strain CIRAD86) TaxID=383855 RepID=M3A0T1_PSEFD|nr:uncharacterized protein MYCFIDRAFT_179465 [Pseudocercospora fijiensis CIRAD86]EME78016.1 hypothetical protein MYCFIDRAFT_179465 [Pseudocercospora fijiensis CIRAD86]